MNIPDAICDEIKKFLINHENDIHYGINDYSDLKSTFEYFKKLFILDLKFVECNSCAQKTGFAALCNSCMENRETIERLKSIVRSDIK